MIARSGKIAAGQRHDSITETSFDGSALVVVFRTQSRHPSLSLTDFITAFLRGQGWLRVAGILDTRLGRDTLTREPLDAATSPLLMTIPPTWLARDGPRI
jgi:hypothetical protein